MLLLFIHIRRLILMTKLSGDGDFLLPLPVDVFLKISELTGASQEEAQDILQQIVKQPSVLAFIDEVYTKNKIKALESELETMRQKVEKLTGYLNHFISYLTWEDQIQDAFKAVWNAINELKTVELTKGTENDIQFYTVKATGECGMSRNGLAKLAGVSGQALSKLEFTLATKAPSKELKPYVGQDFTLATSKQYILTVEDKNLGNLTLYKADYCAAVITYHAMKGNKTALYNLSKFCSLGITKWIHGITGWQPQTIN